MPWIRERDYYKEYAEHYQMSVDEYVDLITEPLHNERLTEEIKRLAHSDKWMYVRKGEDGKLRPDDPPWVEGVMTGLAMLIGLSALLCAAADLLRLSG